MENLSEEDKKEILIDQISVFSVQFADITWKWGNAFGAFRSFSISSRLAQDSKLFPVSAVLDFQGKRLSVTDSDTPQNFSELNEKETFVTEVNLTNLGKEVKYMEGTWKIFWDIGIKPVHLIAVIALINQWGMDKGLFAGDERIPKPDDFQFIDINSFSS